MKKLGSPQTKDFGPLKLTAFDLAEILRLLASSSEPGSNKVELIADDVQYDSAEEFVSESHGRIPKVVRIKSSDPYATIDLHPAFARLYVSKDDVASVGLFAKLESVLRAGERQPKVLYSGWWIVLSLWVLQGLSYIPVLKAYAGAINVAFLLNSAWIVWAIYIHLRRFSLVQPVMASDPRTFWQRNSDNILIALISGLIGAVAGVAATKTADHFWRSESTPATPASAPAQKV